MSLFKKEVKEVNAINVVGKYKNIYWDTRTNYLVCKQEGEEGLNLRQWTRECVSIDCGEEEFAEFLLDNELPALIEEMLVSEFNQEKKRINDRKDKIRAKLLEIRKSYK